MNRQIAEHLVDYEARRKLFQGNANVDFVLATTRNPLHITSFRHYLETYVEYWGSAPAVDKYEMGTYHKVVVGPGCMMCDSDTPLKLMLVKHGLVPSHSLFWQIDMLDVWERSIEELDIAPAPLRNCYQGLWRISPEDYFSNVPFFPLKHIPLLLLCAECAEIFKDTHEEIPQSWLAAA